MVGAIASPGICKDCIAWVELPRTAWTLVLSEGQCRHNPPLGDHKWPLTDYDDWCAQFERAEVTA